MFEGATFADFRKTPGPRVWINASDIYNRTPFIYGEATFIALCSNLATYPIADAVASSAAVPIVFTPMVIKTYPKECTDQPPDWLRKAHNNPNAPPMLKAFADALYSYHDGKTKYVKLLDGGLVDNFGLSGFTISRLSARIPHEPLSPEQAVRLRRSIVILVDAGRAPSGDWVQTVEGPSGIELIKAASDTALQASVRASYTAFERVMSDWQRQIVAWRCGLSPELRKRYGAPANWNCRDLKLMVNRVALRSARSGARQGAQRGRHPAQAAGRSGRRRDRGRPRRAARQPDVPRIPQGHGGPRRAARARAGRAAVDAGGGAAGRARVFVRGRPVASERDQLADGTRAGRSRPCFLMTGAAAGAVRNFCNSLASVCALAPADTPLENTVMFCTSAGIGPRKSMPASWISSLTCWKPISASPLRITDATGTPGPCLLGLGLDLVGDAHLLEQVVHVDAARAGRIADRFRGEQRLLEVVAGCEIGLRRAGLHRDADRRSHEIDLAAGGDLAVLGEGVELGRGNDDEIEHLAGGDLLLDVDGAGPGDGDLVAGRLLELREQFERGFLDRAGGQHLDLGGLRNAFDSNSRPQRRPQQDAFHGRLPGSVANVLQAYVGAVYSGRRRRELRGVMQSPIHAFA